MSRHGGKRGERGVEGNKKEQNGRKEAAELLPDTWRRKIKEKDVMGVKKLSSPAADLFQYLQ